MVIALGILSIPFIIMHPLDSILGALVISGILFFIYKVTKEKGMGFGDVKFAIPMGLILGAKAGFLGLYLAFMIGGIVGIILLIFRLRKMKSMIAFGPFLIAGMSMMLFFQERIYTYFTAWFHF